MCWCLDRLCDAFSDCLAWLFRGRVKLLFLGLDNAGKTTLLSMLAEDSIRAHEAAHHPDARKLIIGNTECTIFDLAGHQQARRSWRHYFRKVWGIVFVVDAADRARLPEARAEIDALLEVEGLTRVPLLVLGNKIDLPGAVSEEEFRTALGLYNPPFHMYEKGPIKVCMCSVIMQQGYGYGFNWLLKQVLGMHN